MRLRRGTPRPGQLRRGTLALGLFLLATLAAAEDWHEAYRAGLHALSRGDAARAIEAFRRAVAERPAPGRNLVTYGTNVEPRYYPYLRLAEAHLRLGQLTEARAALEASATWGSEPADERQDLLARVVAASESRRPPSATPVPPANVAVPPASTPTPTLPPAPVAPALPSPTPSPIPGTTPTPTPGSLSRPAAVPADSKPGPAAPPGPERPTRPPHSPSPEVTQAASSPTTLEIVSHPPGALVYVNDEGLGSTDPETGRLVKTGLPAGRYRVRVSRADHEDATREIDLTGGSRAVFYATLKPAPPSASPVRVEVMALALVAIALVAVVGWIVLRRPIDRRPAIWAPTPRSRPPGTGPGATPAGPLSPGSRRDDQGQEWFGEYRLLEMLGRGGMATVFRAERRAEVCALKRPLASFLDDPDFIERFLREAEIGRTLNHPNIVRILERGEVQRVPYFTMELLDGETLQELVRDRGPAKARTAAGIVVQVAEALDLAHTKGVVHRDLKPSNIMLLPEGTAKVMDFGIARAQRFEGLTVTGAFLGTPDYLAPETIEGKGTEARSDLYALGVVLFELLTGQRPFTGDTPFAILKKHCHDAPPPPSRLQPDVPPELDALVLRLLAKSPEERPASAEELVVALRDWLNRAA